MPSATKTRVWSAQAVSSTTTYNSTAIVLRCRSDISYHFKGTQTSALLGTLIVQVSNSPDSEIDAGTDSWLTYDRIPSIAVSGTTSAFIVLKDFAGKRVRLSYTNTSGTGTLTADANVNE